MYESSSKINLRFFLKKGNKENVTWIHIHQVLPEEVIAAFQHCYAALPWFCLSDKQPDTGKEPDGKLKLSFQPLCLASCIFSLFQNFFKRHGLTRELI